MPVEVTAARPGMGRVLIRRLVISVAVIVIALVPVVAFGLASDQWSASSWAVWGAVTGLVNWVLGGRALALLSAGLLAALTPVAIVSGAVPVAGAGVMAIMCFGVGLSAARGIHRGMMLIPIFMACMLIAPPSWSGHPVDRTTTSYLLWMMVILGGGALWAIVVFPPLLRNRTFAPPERNSRGDTVAYTAIITVLCTASTLAVLQWYPGPSGAWLVITLLVITEVGQQDTVRRTATRVAGTVAGVAIAALVAAPIDNQTVLVSAGCVLLLVALVIRQGPHYGLYMAFMTPAVVLFSSASIADVPKTDAQRLAFTLMAAGLVLLGSALAVAWARYQQSRLQPTTAMAATAQ